MSVFCQYFWTHRMVGDYPDIVGVFNYIQNIYFLSPQLESEPFDCKNWRHSKFNLYDTLNNISLSLIILNILCIVQMLLSHRIWIISNGICLRSGALLSLEICTAFWIYFLVFFRPVGYWMFSFNYLGHSHPEKLFYEYRFSLKNNIVYFNTCHLNHSRVIGLHP